MSMNDKWKMNLEVNYKNDTDLMLFLRCLASDIEAKIERPLDTMHVDCGCEAVMQIEPPTPPKAQL